MHHSQPNRASRLPQAKEDEGLLLPENDEFWRPVTPRGPPSRRPLQPAKLPACRVAASEATPERWLYPDLDTSFWRAVTPPSAVEARRAETERQDRASLSSTARGVQITADVSQQVMNNLGSSVRPMNITIQNHGFMFGKGANVGTINHHPSGSRTHSHNNSR